MRAGYALVTLAPLLWAGNFIIGRAVSGEISALGLNTIRWSIAALIIAPFILARADAAARTLRVAWRELIALSAIGIVVFNTLLYLALEQADVTTTVIVFAFQPLVVLCLTGVFTDQRFCRKQWLGLVLSVAGVLMAVGLKGIGPFGPGMLLAAGATLASAIYTYLLERLKVPGDGVVCLGLCAWIAVVIQVPLAFATGALALGEALPLPSIGALFYLGLFASLVAFTAWQTGVRAIGAARAGVFTNLIPVFALILARLILDEPVNALGTLGLVLTVAGLLITQRADAGVGHRSPREDQAPQQDPAPAPVTALPSAPDPFVDQAVRALRNPQTHSPSHLPAGGLPDRRSA